MPQQGGIMSKEKRFRITLAPEEREKVKLSANLKVIGVGGGGCNAVDYMIKKGLKGVEYIAVNTDAQVLEASLADKKLQIGKSITRGLGAGADPTVGKKAIEENREELQNLLEDSDMVFITAGMGGGTGTGAAPVIAEEAKKLGALVVAVVTEPFGWEGKQRMNNAKEGIAELNKYVDSLIVIPNDRLLKTLTASTSANEAFSKPNEVLLEATQGIADIITIRGIINVDFADVRRVMSLSGKALMGRGSASGENRTVEAAQKAISSPLLDGMSIKGAKKVLLNITGSSDLTMDEIQEGNRVITDAVGEDADIIFGWVVKEDMGEFVSYTVIATGFDTQAESPVNGGGLSLENSKPSHKKVSNFDSTVQGDLFASEKNNEEISGVDLESITSLGLDGKFTGTEDRTGGAFDFDLNEQTERFIDAEKKNDNEDRNDFGGDTSSFLRMMMD
jgi:cell division protein FtsZ